MTTPENPTFTRDEWRALVRHMTTNENRVNLARVAVWRDGRAAATDGHRCLMFRPVEVTTAFGATAWSSPEHLVPAFQAIQAKKAATRKADTVEVLDDMLRVRTTQVRYEASSHAFPPVGQIAQAPKKKDPGRFAVDCRLLADTMSALDGVHEVKKHARGVKVDQFGELEPIHISLETSRGHFLAIVMPVRL